MQSRLNDNIRTLRGYRGVSQAAIARSIGVDPAGITARMKGETEWRTGEVERVAVVLDVPWPWLLEEVSELMLKVTRRGPDGGGMGTTRYLSRRPVTSGFRSTARDVTGVQLLPAAA